MLSRTMSLLSLALLSWVLTPLYAGPPSLTLLDSGGPLKTPAEEGDVPSFASGNLAQAPDAVFFNSPFRQGHVQDSIQDGAYGDSKGMYFRGLPTSGEVYAGVYWTGGARTVEAIALGRDNIFHDHAGRAVGAYTVEYTTATFTPVQCGNHLSACDDSAQTSPTVTWITVGLADDHLSEPTSAPSTRGIRRHYRFPSPVSATAVRVLSVVENVIDELEIAGNPCDLEAHPALELVDVSPERLSNEVPDFAAGNIARAPDAVFFNSPFRQGHAQDSIQDGNWGDSFGMYFRGLPDSEEVYAGVYWTGGGRTVREIAIGRDNIFHDHGDRTVGGYTLEYTTDTFTPVQCGSHTSGPCDDTAQVEPAIKWHPMGIADAHLSEPTGAPTTRGARRRYRLPADITGVTGVRVVSVLENVIDELELGSTVDSLFLPVVCPPEPGLTVLEVSIPVTIPSVPDFASGNIARAPDATFFNSPFRSGHIQDSIQDGNYGDSAGMFFRGLPDSGEVYAGVYWSGGGRTVREIAIGRDNVNHDHGDRAVGAYTLQYTLDDFTPVQCGSHLQLPCDDTAQVSPAIQWCPMGLADDHLSEPTSAPTTRGARRRYTLPADISGVRAVRVVSVVENVIDELEIGSSVNSLKVVACAPPPDLELLEVGGPVTTPAAAGDVPTFAAGNLARAADAVVFATHHRAGHDGSFINDGQYSDNSIIFFRGPQASSGQVYCGIYWSGGGKTIAEVAIGRDNTAGHTNLVSRSYTFEYTLDDFTPVACGDHTTLACDDSANFVPGWCPMDVVNDHCPTGATCTNPGAELRHRYTLSTILTDVRAIRVIMSSASGGLEVEVDELEVGEFDGSLGVELVCNDNTDNDGDGDTDCDDTDCAAAPTCNPEAVCDNNVDDDGDGFTDCQDSDCSTDPACPETVCDNNVDDDGDGFTDCQDSDCNGDPACPETVCDNNVDDDGDGFTDCQDSDCSTDPACPETICDNNVDDDGDGFTDCQDSDCNGDPACPETVCDNNVDDDGDGFTDCQDSDCDAVTNCLTVSIKPGDANQDGLLDLSDPVAFLAWFFGGNPLPGTSTCLVSPNNPMPGPATAVGLQVLDWNCDSALDISDATAQLSWLFGPGAPHCDCSDAACSNCIQVLSPDCTDTCTP